MRLEFCVACGERDAEKLEHHHLVPRSAGGSDEESNLITLCYVCHGKAHGYERQHVRKLSKAGLAAAKARGVKLGAPRSPEQDMRRRLAQSAVYDGRVLKVADAVVPIIQEMRPIYTWREIVARLNIDGVFRHDNTAWKLDTLLAAVRRLIGLGLLSDEVLGYAKNVDAPTLREHLKAAGISPPVSNRAVDG